LSGLNPILPTGLDADADVDPIKKKEVVKSIPDSAKVMPFEYFDLKEDKMHIMP
jgi:hypothetical protein